MKKHISKVNFIVFPFIQFIALTISILESYKYIGFFQKHFYFPAYLIYLASFISFVVYARSKELLDEVRKQRPLRIFFGFGTIAFIIIILLYIFINESESNHYQNYSFTTFHIWPGGLIISIVLSFEAAFLFFTANNNFAGLDKKFYRKFRQFVMLHFKGITPKNLE